MAVITKTPLPDCSALWERVADTDFIDGYATPSTLSPQQAAKVAFDMPGWAQALMGLRNTLVAPFGLKTGNMESASYLFPTEYEDTSELIIGTDDQHLDFRISVMQRAGNIHVATWVRRKNWLGRIYLAVVMPFHILIVKSSMRRIARANPS